MERCALAFGGGGGKGAYQIGVWMALDELNISSNIEAVSGSSVGALNAVLFALGDFKRALEIWGSIKKEDLLSFNSNIKEGLYSRDGLKRLISELDLSRLERSIPVYVNMHNIETECVDSIQINRLSKEDKIRVLLASSAMPLVYAPIVINGKKYQDGGTTNSGNIPIEILCHSGYKHIYVSSLTLGFNIYNISDSFGTRYDVKNRYPDVKFTDLSSLEDIGGIFSGTLNFSPPHLQKVFVAGYRNTITRLKPQEEIYMMKNDYVRINASIRAKMEKLFHNQIEIEKFVQNANFGNVNIMMVTLGGKIFYETIVELYGWKLQQHKLLGLKSHYRILDHNDIRRAWILDPNKLHSALDEYEAGLKLRRKNNLETT